MSRYSVERCEIRIQQHLVPAERQDAFLNCGDRCRRGGQAAGDPPRSIVVAHIDGCFTYAGDNDYRGLLTETDVTEKVLPIADKVPMWSREAQTVLAGGEPQIPVAA